MKQDKIKKALAVLSPFDTEIEDTLKSIDSELASMSLKFKDEVSLKTLGKVNAEFKKLRDTFKPLIDSLQVSFDELKRVLEARNKEADALVPTVNSSLSVSENNLNKRIDSLLSVSENLKTTFNTELKSLRDKIESIPKNTFNSDIDKLKKDFNKSLVSLEDVFKGNLESIKSQIKDVEKEGVNIKRDFIQRLSNMGGGSQNRQIKIDGTDYLTKYTDINFVSGNGISITASNDDTNKRVNITYTVGSLIPITYTGSVDGMNQTFVFTKAPSIIVRDGVVMRKVSSDTTVNWTGTTTVVLSVAPVSDMFAI